MTKYILEFFKANRDSESPVYPTSNSNSLKVTIFK